jgi:hypothetical protein
MNDRRCRYCQQLFQSSRYHPHQLVCSRPDCQRQRRRDYHCRKLRTDAVYHQVCRDSQQKWRSRNSDYPRQYRQSHTQSVERNRQGQRRRDRQRHLQNLAKNNLAFSPPGMAALRVSRLFPSCPSHLTQRNEKPVKVQTRKRKRH